MVIPRKKRTSLFRQRVEKEWSEYFWKFVLKYADKLDWDFISMNPNITMDNIEKYPDKEWDWEWISWNPNITMDIIEKYPDMRKALEEADRVRKAQIAQQEG